MTFVYLVLAHKNPVQLYRLIKALNIDENYFLVHVDAKTAIRPFIKLFENCPPAKIFFCPHRFNISWGCFSMVEATLSLIQYYDKLGIEADYVHLMSGQDYPIQSAENIQRFFLENKGKSFLDYFTLPTEYWPEKGMNRINYLWGLNTDLAFYYNNLDYKDLIQPKTSLPEGITPFGGSQWWSLHTDCIRYIAEECTESNILYNFYRHTLISDEMFFHTFIMNSPLRDTIVNNNLRYTQWQPNNMHPDTITMSHWEDLITSNKLFARKFDLVPENEVMDKLDKNVGRYIPPKNKKQITDKKEKWCVISAVGKTSLHRNWIKNKPQFELHLIVYDDSYDEYKNDTKFVTPSKGYKFKLVYDYLTANQQLLDQYDYLYIPDDDIDIDTKNINCLFRLMEEYKLDIAQPAIINSYYSYLHTLRRPNSILHYTNFVEVMQPCFSREALLKVLFTFNETSSGWGIDFHWGELVDYQKYNMAIIDEVMSIHTRPVQSNHHDELRAYIEKYNLSKEIKEIL